MLNYDDVKIISSCTSSQGELSGNNINNVSAFIINNLHFILSQ